MRKEVTSVFDELLEVLTSITTSEESYETLEDIRYTLLRISRGYQNKYINRDEYEALNKVASLIFENIYTVLEKEIEEDE